MLLSLFGHFLSINNFKAIVIAIVPINNLEKWNQKIKQVTKLHSLSYGSLIKDTI